MKKLLLSASVVAGLFAQPTIESLQKQINELQKQLQELKESQKKMEEKQKATDERYYKKVAPIAANNHLYWGVDLRSSLDYIHAKMKSGKKYSNNVISNRLILTGVYKPQDNLKLTLKIEANNIAGMNGNSNTAYDNSNATANETPDDTNLRVREAFFAYFFGEDNSMMFSAGRRPAVEGYPANLREGDNPESPIAHLTNMEFDGFSLNFFNGAMPEALQDYGTWFKICAGRGYSPNTGKFSQKPYSKSDDHINDFAGFILVPYDNGQYSVWSEFIKAWNVRGYKTTTSTSTSALGDYLGFDVMVKADGIGDGISDFLDDTKAYASFAFSKTFPKDGNKMLGSTDGKSGHSIWIGADMPGFINTDTDRMGISFVHGSKYWRSMTYGEDTLIGSIAAVRGNAFDAYYIHQIIPHLTFSLRGTIFNYKYGGSDAYFGAQGNPDKTDYVKKAQDIRAYIRYNF